ncbi:MAG: 50S ribosomal protein L17 [Ruoffia tabacinasalis]|jgi:large subunit ribosomal protein L17|uniref:Large ribosomal subunit protein bL17 n=2 Tax=Ruoffia TaxID=2862144 RepID=A0A839A8K8_9LACT|nr:MULTISPECIES: 50S ribosomal protein L17 [Ruoffia]HBY89632.1 50S ribosomal protein L17 [Aerococcaceae bacterium]MBA5729875.1 50S ribosomal protein L17 [Ruoffia halotolerans]MBG9977459.1 50S ribosomal protein L17 [Ruoffia tabacinasalis]TLQ41578.1 50S ribosomal protein L17 [Ruoffia tabacinasalis]HJG48100.1 50S ribosomal protein L17 [Ruoffia tabacinasalis]
MAYRKLGRTSTQRKALLRDLTTDVIINERIETTEARAKEVRKTVEKMITLGKKGDLASRRKAASFLRRELADARIEDDEVIIESVLDRLFDNYANRYENRNGGYTRILKKGPRRGDAAPMVILELV